MSAAEIAHLKLARELTDLLADIMAELRHGA
jgi:hypothetical protein